MDMRPEAIVNNAIEKRQTTRLYGLNEMALILEAQKLTQLKIGVKGQEVIAPPISKLVKHRSWETRRVSLKDKTAAQGMLEAHPEATDGMDLMHVSQLSETLAKLHAARQRSLSSIVGWLARPTRGYITSEDVDQTTGKIDITRLEKTPYFKLETNRPLLETLEDFRVGKRSRLMNNAPVQSSGNEPFRSWPNPNLLQFQKRLPVYPPTLPERMTAIKERIIGSALYKGTLITFWTSAAAAGAGSTIPHFLNLLGK